MNNSTMYDFVMFSTLADVKSDSLIKLSVFKRSSPSKSIPLFVIIFFALLYLFTKSAGGEV